MHCKIFPLVLNQRDLDKGIEIYTKFADLKYSHFRRFDPTDNESENVFILGKTIYWLLLLRYDHVHVNVEGLLLKPVVACEDKFERAGWHSFELKAQLYAGHTLLDPRIVELLAAHLHYQGEERLITLV
jgi:hypothetical protein